MSRYAQVMPRYDTLSEAVVIEIMAAIETTADLDDAVEIALEAVGFSGYPDASVASAYDLCFEEAVYERTELELEAAAKRVG